jgi:hypothetical protein
VKINSNNFVTGSGGNNKSDVASSDWSFCPTNPFQNDSESKPIILPTQLTGAVSSHRTIP